MATAQVICITGIDTDIGKTVVTGLLAKYLLECGKKVITQKLCQTGCLGYADDILTHRKIMGIEPVDADYTGLTCPYVFKEPCSPHLAARLEGRSIDPAVISAATNTLRQNYDFVLLEGAGGLMVPLNDKDLLIDYVQSQGYDILLASCPRLGSINHTLAALELLKARRMNVLAIVYNRYLSSNQNITADSRSIFYEYMRQNGYKQNIIDVFDLNTNMVELPDFSPLFA